MKNLMTIVIILLCSCSSPTNDISSTNEFYKILDKCVHEKFFHSYLKSHIINNEISVISKIPLLYDNKIFTLQTKVYKTESLNIIIKPRFITDENIEILLASLNKESAIIIIRITKQNIIGTFNLSKKKEWVIDKAEVVQY